jgi:3-oxoadipate enol-lactonase/4-carboxymuconolactone decarboxylase
MDEKEARGYRVRRDVHGDEHIDHVTGAVTPFTADFAEMVNTYVFGGPWARPGLDRRTRFVITLTALMALGRHDEFEIYTRSALRHGLTQGELKEILLHGAVYLGVPAANSAFAVAQRVLNEGSSA